MFDSQARRKTLPESWPYCLVLDVLTDSPPGGLTSLQILDEIKQGPHASVVMDFALYAPPSFLGSPAAVSMGLGMVLRTLQEEGFASRRKEPKTFNTPRGPESGYVSFWAR